MRPQRRRPLSRHGFGQVARQDAIEGALARRQPAPRHLGCNTNLTSKNFEADHCTLAHYSHSRDGSWVVIRRASLGILSSAEGMQRLAVSVFERRTADPESTFYGL